MIYIKCNVITNGHGGGFVLLEVFLVRDNVRFTYVGPAGPTQTVSTRIRPEDYKALPLLDIGWTSKGCGSTKQNKNSTRREHLEFSKLTPWQICGPSGKNRRLAQEWYPSYLGGERGTNG